MNDDFVALSVSEVARIENKTVQTIYNWIRMGLYDVIEFRRGSKMRGLLVRYPKTKLRDYGK